ncbi:36353_t:CDS:2, partial [Gigaspora margarita]
MSQIAFGLVVSGLDNVGLLAICIVGSKASGIDNVGGSVYRSIDSRLFGLDNADRFINRDVGTWDLCFDLNPLYKLVAGSILAGRENATVSEESIE